ncbi:MAG: MBL fold metallo-hydrolase [Muribaculaceae bacterium]|nr:MBL fold metallo-hydrolase [Muribaculaceae bacterium]
MSKKIYFEHPELPFEEWSNPYGSVSEPEIPTSVPKPLYFCSFGSGSSGNSCYVGSAEGGLIVDVGIRAEELERCLASNGISMKHVKGVLLTHDHSDHVKYVYALLRNHRHLKLFCTNRVLNGMLRKHSISKRIKEYHVPIFKEIPFKMLDFEITAFDVPHDGSDNMGFSIEFDSRRFVVATDLGEVTERARFYMSRANYLMIEANYDAHMLRIGRYPEYLKARIASGSGHLDNRQTAAFLTEIINPGLNHIFLCHLSQDNNTPEIALGTVREALESKGLKVGNAMETLEDRKADVQLAALPRFDMTRWFVFRK